jgi:hypothetical protein
MTDVQATFTDENGKQRLTGTISGNFGGALETVTVALAPADILALSSSPFELVAARGAGKVIVPLSLFSVYTPGGNAYNLDGNALNVPLLGQASGMAVLLEEAEVPNVASAAADTGTIPPGGNFAALWAVSGAPLILWCQADPTAGNGSLVVTVLFSVITI